MGGIISDLQFHILESIPDASANVDLLRIAKERSKRESPLKLVVDGECCLDRLYGGYYPDWVCGGQWDKMEQFLQNFSRVIHNSNLDLVIFFNGTLETGEGMLKSYQETFRLLEEITKHVTLKKKPPPKVWWIPPAYLRSSIRQALRIFDIKVMCTMEDHRRDIVRFCQRNRFHGILADNPEYLIFDSLRYFSAKKLKLTFKGSLETVEIKLKKVYETLNVPKERIFIFCALLGNHFLTEGDLNAFYASLGIQKSEESKTAVIEKLAQFVRELDTKDPGKVAAIVAAKSFQLDSSSSSTDEKEKLEQQQQVLASKVNTCLQHFLDVKALPSSTNKTNKTKKAKKPKNNSPNAAAAAATKLQNGSESDKPLESPNVSQNGDGEGESTPSASPGSDSKTSPKPPEKKEDSVIQRLLYRISPKVEEVATGRHKAGVMSPYICQIMKHREIKLPLIIEDVRPGKSDTPRAHDIFRPLRQRVYAILFNLHHLNFLAKQRNERVPPIQVKETYFCTKTKQVKSQTVTAVGFSIPTVEKLWLGEGEDCKNKRIRAFLTIMNSDNRMIIDQEFVPQQMVILTAVLRYLLHSDKKLLRQAELDAFVAQAFIQDMTDPNMAQDIEVSNLTMRGVHLSHVFMEGVEMALLANDACGAPIPYMLFCPWLFFNGKIFNYVLEQQSEGKSLNEICGFKTDLLYSIDQLSIAICDGIKNPFAPEPAPQQMFIPGKHNRASAYLARNHQHGYNSGLPVGVGMGINPLLPHGPPGRIPYTNGPQHQNVQAMLGYGSNGNSLISQQYPPPNYIPRSRGLGAYNNSPHPNFGGSLMGNSVGPSNLAGAGQNRAGGFTHPGLYALYNNTSDSGRQRRVQDRGGQLEVGGVVVGSWGANYGPGPSNALQGGRIARSSLIAQQSARITPLIPPRISMGHPNKIINGRGPVGTNHWAQKRGSRITKKSIMKKPGEGKPKMGGHSGSQNSSGVSPKTKGVTFKEDDESNKAEGANDVAAVAESVSQLSLKDSDQVSESSSPSVENSTSDSIPAAVVEGV